MINSLPPDLLRSFVAVAQTKSFSRAAERVHLSQSTVSQQIRRLEAIVGKSLFERDTRSVTLTRHGTALQNYAARILDLMSETVEHFRAPALSSHVRLGLSEDFASAGLTAALVSFLRRNPEVELTVEIGMSGDLFRQLDEGRYDLVFAKRLHGSCLVLDIRLTGLSGLDFQTELANANLLTRIILLPPVAKQAGPNLLGATCEATIGLRSLALPAGLALLAVAMGRPANIEGGRGS